MGQWLGSIVHGSYNDHAVPGTMRTLGTFRRRVIRLWRRFGVILRRWVPTQCILHPLPRVRFDAMYPRSEP
jgi:hypothetical protein